MAKKAIIEREKKRAKLVAKISPKRQELKNELKRVKRELSILREKVSLNKKETELLQNLLQEKFKIELKIRKLPRNSHPTRQRIRCAVTGRPRGVLRKFGICRHILRLWISLGYVPDISKSSW